MQITAKKKANTVAPINRASVKNAGDKKLRDTPYYHLLLLFAEGCDENANGGNFYVTLGATKAADALSLSVNLNGDRQTLYDSSLHDLAVQAADLHDAL